MDASLLSQALADLPLGPLHFYQRIDSTNTQAARLADAGTPDLTLLVADEQTAGRGRSGRKWFTPPGAALAFSLVLRLLPAQAAVLEPPALLGRYTALGALAVALAFREDFGLNAQIKWPNDVLLDRRKACGILAEAQWNGSELAAVILGLGVNVSPASIPPQEALIYPATCVETVLGRQVERIELLRLILERLLNWRSRLVGPDFWNTWNRLLAFKGERVYLFSGLAAGKAQPDYAGTLVGLDAEGCLLLKDDDGREQAVRTGEIHLRPSGWMQQES